ncbi:MAG: MarR family transcriptional regulator [Cardiobacteriaceae bacterium]|nr:MarR family transcriptional regulator [Cardiobacteriaceae bacterium]
MEKTLLKEDSAGYLANHMARLFAVLLTERLKPLGLAPAPFAILLELWRQDGQSQNALVASGDIAQATVANTLIRMERDGLVTRAPHPQDARSKCIMLTDKARALEESATRIAREVNHEALAGLDAAERAQLLALMRKVIATQRSLRGLEDAQV